MTAHSEGPRPAVDPPDAVYTRQRWIPQYKVQWAKECDQILMEHGAVVGNKVYEYRYQARHRAQYLMKMFESLGMHYRWELKEHTERRSDGWAWSVEYLGGSNAR
jgi:hypothetical protein